MSRARDLAGIFNLNPLSGTTAQRPATAEVGAIFYNGTNGTLEVYTSSGWKSATISQGNTSSRPASPFIGQLYANGELQRLEIYTGASYGWQNIVAETPGVIGYTGTVLETNTTNTINITGTNFASGAIVTLVGTDGTEYSATSTTVNNLTSITATFGSIPANKEPYDIRVTNPSNLYGVYYDVLTVNDSPVWATSSGNIGSVIESNSASFTISATDEENQSLTYSILSGSLPTGLTLNSSTGVVSGTAGPVTGDTTYTFTARVSDGNNNSDRSFNIIVTDSSSIADVFGDSSIKLYYKLDSDFTDFAGNASTFTTSNITFTSGKVGNSATYNGSSSYSYKDVSSILPGTVDRSYSLWCYLNSAGSGQRQLLFGHGAFGTTQQNFDLEANCYHNGNVSDSYGVHYWGNGIKFDSATTLYDQWVHLVITQSGGNINQTNTKLYVNGVLKTLNSIVPSPTPQYSIPNSSRICIGTRYYGGSGDLYSNGKVDQVRIFNRVLTQSEVNKLYNSGSGY